MTETTALGFDTRKWEDRIKPRLIQVITSDQSHNVNMIITDNRDLCDNIFLRACLEYSLQMIDENQQHLVSF